MANAPLDSPQPDPQQPPPTRQWSADPMDPRRCVVMVPFPGHIARQCQFALEELQRRGYDVCRVGGYAAVDQGRNQMATDALAAGYEETFWSAPSANGPGSAGSRSLPTPRSGSGTSASTPTAGKTLALNTRGTIRSSS